MFNRKKQTAIQKPIALNVETIKFIDKLNSFARSSAIGIVPISQVTQEIFGKDIVIYDDIKPRKIKASGFDYDIALECSIEENGSFKRQSTYSDYPEYNDFDIKVSVSVNKDGEITSKPRIIITSKTYENLIIYIEDGKWYCI